MPELPEVETMEMPGSPVTAPLMRPVMLPVVEAPCRLLAKEARKLVSDADPLLPPRAVTSLSKLLWSVASAELAAVLLVDVLLDELDSV